MSNLAPGTYVSETVAPSFTGTAASGSAAVFVGYHPQGPTVPVLVQSWTQFRSAYGGFGNAFPGGNPSALALAVYQYFNNGGGQCYVLRVVHTGDATPANNASAAAGDIADGTAVDTLSITAANPGAWGNRVSYAVTASVTGLFNITIYYGGIDAGSIVERFTDLSMDPHNSRYVVSVINNPNTGSNYVRVGDLQGVGTTIGNVPAPVGPTALGAGGEELGVDGIRPTASDLTNVTSALDYISGPLVINVPDAVDPTANYASPAAIQNAFINYCANQRAVRNAMVVCDPPQGQNKAGLLSYVNTALTVKSSYAALYAPWLIVNDPASSVTGAQRSVPPGALAMGQWAATDAARGVQKAPAGPSTALSAIGLETPLSSGDIGDLTAAHVNCIRYLPGGGIVVWGARTLSSDTSVEYINNRRQLIDIENNLLALTAFAAFEPNDSVTWSTIVLRLNAYLLTLQSAGAFAGATPSQSFYIVCDQTNNVPSNNTINAQVGVALAAPAEFVLINVSQWNTGSSTTIRSTAGVAFS